MINRIITKKISNKDRLKRQLRLLNNKWFNFKNVHLPNLLKTTKVFLLNLLQTIPWIVFIFLSSYWFGFSWAVETFLASVATYFLIKEISHYLLLLVRRTKQ